MASTSASTSSTGRSDDFVPLYTGQKVQRFQVQLRMTRTSRLCASLGGRIGPCSKGGVRGSGADDVTRRSVDVQAPQQDAEEVHERPWRRRRSRR